MKRAGILVLTLILIAAMFTGCRRQPTDTTGMTGSTSSTVLPSTTNPITGTTMPSTTTVIPGTTDGTTATDGTDMTRGRMAPRY